MAEEKAGRDAVRRNATSPKSSIRRSKPDSESPIQPLDDERLPGCAFTAEEFKELQEQMQALQEKRAAFIANSRPGIRVAYTNKAHPCQSVYMQLVERAKKLTGKEKGSCVLCGNEVNVKNSPICRRCRFAFSRGYLSCKTRSEHWKKDALCEVCHGAPVFMRRMCKRCYAYGEIHGTHDPKKVQELRLTYRRPTKYKTKNSIALANNSVEATFKLVPHDWDK